MFDRLRQLDATLRWLKPLAGGLVASARILIQRRRDPGAVLTLAYKGAPLHFRGIDSSALEEVLGNEEYAFLQPCLLAAAAPRILDVGAHIGTFALWVFGVNRSARILSVEANGDTFAVTRQNREASGDAAGRWSLINKAAGARDGELLPFLTEGPSMSHRVSPRGDRTVEAISLGTLLRRTAGWDGAVDLMKVDIEGSEEAFLCAEPALLAKVGRLVVELHPERCDTERVRRELAAHYNRITEAGRWRSSKPLLFCERAP